MKVWKYFGLDVADGFGNGSFDDAKRRRGGETIDRSLCTEITALGKGSGFHLAYLGSL